MEKLFTRLSICFIITTYFVSNGTAQKYEAEANYLIISNVGGNGNISTNSNEPINNNGTGRAVLLPDSGDKIRIFFNVSLEGRYIIRVRLRSGEFNSNVDDARSFYESYRFSLDETSFPLYRNPSCPENSKLTLQMPTGGYYWGGAYWGLMIGMAKNLTIGSHYIDIESTKDYAGIDHLEIEHLPNVQNRINVEDISGDPVSYDVALASGQIATLDDPIYDCRGELATVFFTGNVLEINLNAPQDGTYEIRCRLRTGDRRGTRILESEYEFYVNGIQVNLSWDGSQLETQVAWGTSTWGILKNRDIKLNQGNNSFEIKARDNAIAVDYVEFEFIENIEPTNNNPSNITLSNNQINENVVIGTQIGTFTTTDDTGDSHTYSFAGNNPDNNSFSLNGNRLLTKVDLDFETKSTYAIRIRTTDQGGLSFEKDFTIRVSDVNENRAPSGISISDDRVNENVVIGTQIGTFTTTDDTGDTHTYSFAGNNPDNNSFSLNGNRLLTKEDLDFETKSTYAIRIRTTDQGGLSFEKDFTIRVSDVNENRAPSGISISDDRVNENVVIGTQIGTFTTTDDTGDTHTYSFAGNNPDNNSFSLNGNRLLTKVDLDFETKSTYAIRIRTTDQGGLSFEKDFTIFINNLGENRRPTDIKITSNEILEKLPTTSDVGIFSTEDLDDSDFHSYKLVNGDGDEDNNRFSINENLLASNEIFYFNQKSSYSIRVRSTDSAGEFIEKVFSIKIINVNEAPTEINISSNGFNENLSIGSKIATFTTSDPDEELDIHSYTLVAGIGSIDNDLFDINETSGVLVTSTLFNYENPPKGKTEYSIRVRTIDLEGESFEDTFTIRLRNINDKASEIVLDKNYLFESAQLDATIGNLSVIDEENDFHTIKVTSVKRLKGNILTIVPNNSFYIFDNTTLKLNTSASLELVDSYDVEIEAVDNSNLKISSVFNIKIKPIPPKIVSDNFNKELASSYSIQQASRPSITVSGINNLGSVKIKYGGIRDEIMKDSIFLQKPSDSILSSAFDYKLGDELGIMYQFFIYDINEELVDSSDIGYAYRYWNDDTSPSIPNIVKGSNQNDYEIVAIPYTVSAQVSEIFDELGDYDPFKWRLFEFKNNINAEMSTGLIEKGKGYWLIVNDIDQYKNLNIKIGSSSTELNDNEPVKIGLRRGWNLIGNPYDFDLNWLDIRKCNTTLSDSIKYFEREFNVIQNSSVLKKYRGAFVYSTTSQELIFPYKKQVDAASNCRVASSLPNRTPLSSSSWQVPLEVYAGEVGNKLSAIGMHTQGKPGFDLFDDFAVPRFSEFVDITFLNESDEKISKDITQTADHHIWEFYVNTNVTNGWATIKWDNSFFGEGNKSLWLFDTELNNLVRMGDENSYKYKIRHESRKFKIYFGEEDYLIDNVLPEKIKIGNTFPNPVNKTINIPISLPKEEGSYNIDLVIYDIIGNQVFSMSETKIKHGFHNSKISVESNRLNKGLYLVKVVVQSNVKEAVSNQKIHID